MLNDSKVTANIPAGDLKRAREFYAEVLGITPVFQVDGVMLVYTTGAGRRSASTRPSTPVRPATPSPSGMSTT